MLQGWSLDDVKIEIAEEYRRQGYGLSLFQWLKENTPTEYIYVECVNTEEMHNFLSKHQATLNTTQNLYSPYDWVIKKTGVPEVLSPIVPFTQ